MNHPAKTVLNGNCEDLNVFENKIADFSVLYVAEMDYASQTNNEKADFGPGLEFKTTIDLHNREMSDRFALRCQKYWAQCYLVGLKKAIIGYRNKGNWVEKYSVVRTKDFVNLSYRTKQWSWKQGVIGLQNFLRRLKNLVVLENNLYVLRLDYKTGTLSYWDSEFQVFI